MSKNTVAELRSKLAGLAAQANQLLGKIEGCGE